jgi:hypothetical protein
VRRDWDLIRLILLRLEAEETATAHLGPDAIPGYDAERVSYHYRLLDEGGLIRAFCADSIGAPLHCWAVALTWPGHELLDQIRRDSTWNRVKAVLRERGVDLSWHVVRTAAAQVLDGLL